VLALQVDRAPFGARILVLCRGKGCPFHRRSMLVATARGCGAKGNGCRSRTVCLESRFHKHALVVGDRISVEIVRSGWIGKYYSFTIRSGHAPRVKIDCLAPGGSRPGIGC
jgi:hypothetical protein